MKFLRRQFLHLAGSAAALPIVSRFAWAQAYPSRPVHLIVGFAPGGSTDIAARLIGQWLSERFGQQFIIENRPGAATNIATEAVVNAAPDGYTLLLAGASAAINATLYEKLNFNFISDIAPVGTIVCVPNVMAVNLAVPAKTVPEFIAYAKANPGKINMASGGSGSAPHIAGEFFKLLTGVNMLHVPYRGEAPALTDLLGGQVQICFSTLPSTIEYVRADRLSALAVTTSAVLSCLSFRQGQPLSPARLRHQIHPVVPSYNCIRSCRTADAAHKQPELERLRELLFKRIAEQRVTNR
jgi:tripartite-type tricarboxylate transporter receptor subunit TctC